MEGGSIMTDFATLLKTTRIAVKLTQQQACALFRPPIAMGTWRTWEQDKHTPNPLMQAAIIKKLKEYTK
jgi:hypothetical protein